MVSLDDIPLVSPEIVGRAVDQEAVIVDPSNAQVKVLNEVGAYIWSMIDGKHSVHEIAQLVCLVYDVDAENSAQDTLVFITNLFRRGLVIFKDSNS